MNVKQLAITLVSVLCLFVTCARLAAQSGAGSIQGTVTDATGAVIPAASVHVTNQATGVSTDSKTNGVGFYQVPGLFTGTYSLTVTVPGMKTYTTSIELLVAQNAVINPVLTPGRVTQQITVNAGAAQLTTVDSGTIGSTLENERIDSLPTNGRSMLTLIGETTPGMEDNGSLMNGQAREAFEYDIDGTSTENNAFGGQYINDNGQSSDPSSEADSPPIQLMDPDAVQEVKISASNAGAQYSMPATAIMTTKSGTNRLHGSLFETARNNAFGVARTIQDPVNYSAPHLVRNEFGVSAGGPIVLPHVYHGKDKSFWFLAYERYSLSQSKATLTTVPETPWTQGNFNGLTSSSGVPITLYDPATTTSNAACPIPSSTKTESNAYCRTPFSNNTISSTEISPIGQLYAELLPPPTNSANPLVQGNYTALNPYYIVIPQVTFRLDHEFNQNNRAYLRYTQNLGNTDSTSSGVVNLPVNSSGVNIPARAVTGWSNAPESSFVSSLNYTHIFSPTFFLETIAAQQWLDDQQVPGTAINTDYESMLNLPNNFGEVGFPSITGALVSLGSSQENDATVEQIVSTLDENFTKIAGRNQMYFGGRFQHTREAVGPNHTADVIDFDTLPTALYEPSTKLNYTAYANTGTAGAALFMGTADSYSVNLEPPYARYRQLGFDAYFQDDYHLSKNLTVNLGLRYEAHPAIYTKDTLDTSFDLANDAMVLGNTPANLIAKGYTTQAIITNLQWIGVKFETAQQAGMPSGLMRNYDLNFLPRVGLAWQPFRSKWGTVLRGAYGRYDYPTPLQNNVDLSEKGIPYEATYTQSYTATAQAIDAEPNELIRYNDAVTFGVAGKNTANVVNSGSTTSILPGQNPSFIDPNWAPTFVSETNFTLEQPFKGHSVVSASYVWTHASNLDVLMYPNHHPSTYRWEMTTGTTVPNGGASVIGTPLAYTYSTTTAGPYDRTTWGSTFDWHTRAGWSNYNALQLNYQRLYHHGYAYQFSYVYDKALRMGNDHPGGWATVYPLANYPGELGTLGTMTSPDGPYYVGAVPPPLPTGTAIWADYHALNKFQEYKLDSEFPTMHIRFNWLVDLPVGQGKRFFGNANRFVNELIGGFQLAGDGNIYSGLFQPNQLGGWGSTAPLTIYKHKAPLTDCLSGICEKAYLWYNGYLAPTATSGATGSTCTTNCISGIPASYQPVQTWIDNTPNTTDYETNDVMVTLTSGTQVKVGYNGDAGGATNTNSYLAKTFIHGPVNWPMDASLFKVFPITERVNLRVNVDAFNVFNMPGENAPDSTTGIQTFLTSYNAPRELQITARLTF